MKFIDLTGKKINNFTVLSRAPNDKSGGTRWNCLCECGKEFSNWAANISKNKVKSCGCWRKKMAGTYSITHGMSHTKEHKAWLHLRERCNNPKDPMYPNYGGRGIKVCKRWQNSFINFFNDVGLAPSKKHSIDRIDNNQDYKPGNCKWSTSFEQARNRRNNRLFSFNGETKCLPEWAEIYGLKSRFLYKRVVTNGWSIEKALTTPKLQ